MKAIAGPVLATAKRPQDGVIHEEPLVRKTARSVCGLIDGKSNVRPIGSKSRSVNDTNSPYRRKQHGEENGDAGHHDKPLDEGECLTTGCLRRAHVPIPS